MNKAFIMEQLARTPFVPHPAIKNGHAQTIFGSLIPRRTPLLNGLAKTRFFDVAPATQVSGDCAWQAEKHNQPTLLLLHGMEGSIASGYMLGTAEQALGAGFNVVRINHRNCGGTEHLTPTLYHAGLTDDVRLIVRELIDRDGLKEIYLAGFSLGGNVAVKLAGEYAKAIPPEVKAVIAVSPSIDLSICADAIETRSNLLYHINFVMSLRNRMRRKAKLFPDRYDASKLQGVWTIRKFDDIYTSRHAGFRDVTDYYERASAIRFVKEINVPTLLLHAKDDPFIPFSSFESREVKENPQVTLLATEHGGHVGFLSASKDAAGRFWYEKKIVEWVNLLRTSETGIQKPESSETMNAEG